MEIALSSGAWKRRSAAAGRWASVLLGFAAFMVLLGWITGTDRLTRGLAGWPAMHPFTAVCFLLLAVSAWSGMQSQASTAPLQPGVWRYLSLLTALIAGLLGGGQLLSYLAGADVALDQILFPGLSSNAVQSLSPVSLPASIIIAFGGLSAFLLALPSRRPAMTGQLLGLIPGFIGLVSLAGHVSGTGYLYGYATSIHTAILACLLTAGLLCIRSDPESSPFAGFRATQLILVLLTGVVIILTALHSYHAVDHELTQAELSRRAVLSQLAASALSERLGNIVTVGVSLASRVRFRQLVADGQWAEAIGIMRSVPHDFPLVDRLFVTDVDGTLQADVPEQPGIRGRNFSFRDWYQGVRRDWRPFVSPVYKMVAEPQRSVFSVAVPIKADDGRILGILVLRIRMDNFFEWTEGIKIGQDGLLSVVDSKGQIVFDSKQLSQGETRPVAVAPVLAKLLRGQHGVEVAFDPLAQEEYVFAYFGASHGWNVVVQQPARAAFAGRDRQLRYLLISYGLILLLFVAMIFLLMRSVTYRRQAEEDRRMKTELEQRVAERTAQLRNSNEALAQEQTTLRMLQDTVLRLSQAEDVGAAYAMLLETVCQHMGWTYAQVWQPDSADERLVCRGPWHAARPGLEEFRHANERLSFGRGESFLGQVWETQQPLWIWDIEPDAARVRRALIRSFGFTAWIGMPVLARGKVIAIVEFYESGQHGQRSDKALNLIAAMTVQIGPVLLRKQAEDRIISLNTELERHAAQLELANKELESFSYSVSHDLRTPLRAIDGFSRMLEEDYDERLDDEGRRLIGVVRQNSQKMGRLIDDLLAFSRLGKKQLAVSAIDMAKMAREVFGELAPDGHHIIFKLDSLPPAQGDPVLVRQAWVNLLSNAIKFSGTRKQPEIEVRGYADDVLNVYGVKDNGVGFDASYYDKLFGVFQRLHSDEEFPGTGVGLAIVQRVVARHDGRVWAESKIGEGATFCFSLPKEEGERNA